MSRKTIRVGGPAPRVKPEGIDPRGDDVVLEYVEGFVQNVPARDLTGADLAREAYVRRVKAALNADEPRPGPGAGDEDVPALASELVVSGVYAMPVPPAAPIETSPPAEPAAPEPEA